MAPWTPKDKPAPDHERDLGTLLSADQRAELTLLVANITKVGFLYLSVPVVDP